MDRVTSGSYSTPAEIRGYLTSELPTVAMAVFDKEDYSGDYTTDLFSNDDTTYFNDAGQFFELQKAAAEKVTAEFDKQNDWAVFIEGSFSSLEYGKAEKGCSGGVAVCLRHDGKVEVVKGLVRKDIDESVSSALKSRPKATYAKSVCEYIAMQKSAAVQAALIRNPRKAREVAVADMLRRGHRHDCLSYFHEIAKEQPHLDAINEEAAELLALLGEERDYAPFSAMSHVTCIEEEAYDLVQLLDDQQLDRLFVYLAAVEFGQKKPEELDTREYNLFNRVACDPGVDMRDYWKPDQWFLSRRTMAQLQAIIAATGHHKGNGLKPPVRQRGKVQENRSCQDDVELLRQGSHLQEPETRPATGVGLVARSHELPCYRSRQADREAGRRERRRVRAGRTGQGRLEAGPIPARLPLLLGVAGFFTTWIERRNRSRAAVAALDDEWNMLDPIGSTLIGPCDFYLNSD